MVTITLLDHDLTRITVCENRLKAVLAKLNVTACVYKNMEPPYLSRLSFNGKFPAMEVDGNLWARDSAEAFTENEIKILLKKIGLIE